MFVGGLHRSGTTALARALAAHPEVSGLSDTGVPEDEGQHLQDVYPKIRAHGGMGRFAHVEEAHLVETSPLVTPSNRQKLLKAWTPYWDLTRPNLLEKSPSNMIKMRFLQELFPGSAFVVVVRHPVVVALAMQKWNPVVVARNGRRRVSMLGLVSHWARAHHLLLVDSEHVEHLHVLRYEDLVSDPLEVLKRLSSALALDPAVEGGNIRGGYDQPYWDRWQAMASGGAVARHRHRAIVEKYAGAARTFGYDIADPRALSPWSWT